MLLMGKLTISMAIFNSYVSLPEGIVCGAPVRWLAKLVHITVPMMFIIMRPIFSGKPNHCLYI